MIDIDKTVTCEFTIRELLLLTCWVELYVKSANQRDSVILETPITAEKAQYIIDLCAKSDLTEDAIVPIYFGDEQKFKNQMQYRIFVKDKLRKILSDHLDRV